MIFARKLVAKIFVAGMGQFRTNPENYLFEDGENYLFEDGTNYEFE